MEGSNDIQVIEIPIKDLRRLISNLIKQEVLKKSKQKRKRITKRDLWINVIKEHKQELEILKRQRNLKELYKRLTNTGLFKKYPITYQYFLNLVNDILE